MDSKLSVDCLLRLVENLTFEDTKLFYRKIFNEFNRSELHFSPPYMSGKIVIKACLKDTEQLYEMLFEDSEFKTLDIETYLNHPDINLSSVYCKICGRTMIYQEYLREQHKHPDYTHTQDEYYEHIRTNSKIIIYDSKEYPIRI